VCYFQGLRAVLGPQVPAELRSVNRSRRPPLDRFNALLGFGYGLLHTAVMRAILAAGLEPALGFFHTPRSAAYPLVLDLMELWRVPLWGRRS
jgi:CRISPR-associated protein Cas1